MFSARREPVRARTLVVAALAALVGLVSPHVAAAPQQGNNKTIYVAAVDPLNKPVTGLGKDTWAVREDNQDRAIVDAKPATDPLDVILLIDTSVNLQPSVSDVRAGLLAFATTLFAGPSPVTLSIVDVAGADPTVADSKKTLDDVTKVLSKTFADRAGGVVMIDAMNDAAKKLAKAPTPRRAIVVVNLDGVPDNSANDMQRLIPTLIASNASLWAVTYQNTASKGISNGGSSGAGAAGAGVNLGGVGQGDVGAAVEYILSKAPEATGGRRDQLTTSTALTDSLTRIANSIQGQYAITYARPDNKTPKLVQCGNSTAGVTVLYSTTPIK